MFSYGSFVQDSIFECLEDDIGIQQCNAMPVLPIVYIERGKTVNAKFQNTRHSTARWI